MSDSLFVTRTNF